MRPSENDYGRGKKKRKNKPYLLHGTVYKYRDDAMID